MSCQESSGLSSLNRDRLPGGASRATPTRLPRRGPRRLAALLIAYLCPISSLFAPCDPGAARQHPILIQRRQATSGEPVVERAIDRLVRLCTISPDIIP